jgi:hypothetical protein
MTSYALFVNEGAPAILCLICGKTSYHPMDIAQRYCAKCQLFHEDTNIYVRTLVDGQWQSVSLASLPDAERKKWLAKFRKDKR